VIRAGPFQEGQQPLAGHVEVGNRARTAGLHQAGRAADEIGADALQLGQDAGLGQVDAAIGCGRQADHPEHDRGGGTGGEDAQVGRAAPWENSTTSGGRQTADGRTE
jgi:hypothetical protein